MVAEMLLQQRDDLAVRAGVIHPLQFKKRELLQFFEMRIIGGNALVQQIGFAGDIQPYLLGRNFLLVEAFYYAVEMGKAGVYGG